MSPARPASSLTVPLRDLGLGQIPIAGRLGKEWEYETRVLWLDLMGPLLDM